MSEKLDDMERDYHAAGYHTVSKGEGHLCLAKDATPVHIVGKPADEEPVFDVVDIVCACVMLAVMILALVGAGMKNPWVMASGLPFGVVAAVLTIWRARQVQRDKEGRG